MRVYVICVLGFILADLVTGLVRALYEKDFQSSIMRQGLFHKAGEIFVLTLLYGVEYVAPMLGLTFNLPTFRVGVGYCVLMEVGSIIENLRPFTPGLGSLINNKREKETGNEH